MEIKKYYQYGWSFLVPIVYTLLLIQNLRVNYQPLSDLAEWTPLLIAGVAQGLAVVWLVRQMPTKKYRITAIIGAVFFIFAGFALGGLTGKEGVLLNTSLATLAYVIAAWFAGHKQEGAKLRTWIVVGAYFGLAFLLPIVVGILFGPAN